LGHLIVTLGASEGTGVAQVIETMDILIECAIDVRVKPLGEPSATFIPSQTATAVPATDPQQPLTLSATQLMEEVEKRRYTRIQRLSKSAKMWRAHVVEEKVIDLRDLKRSVVERWERQSCMLGKEANRALIHLATATRYTRDARVGFQQRLAHLLRADLPDFKVICADAYHSVEHASPDVLLDELEVGLGDVVESRYDESCVLREEAVTAATADNEKLFAETVKCLTALARAEYKRGKSVVAVITTFDAIDNVTRRISTMPKRSLFPLTTPFRERLLQELSDSSVPIEFDKEIRSALASVEAGLHQAFTHSLSVDTIADLDSAAAISINRLRQLIGALTHIGELCKTVVGQISGQFRESIVQRMMMQQDVVAAQVDHARQVYNNHGKAGLKQLFHRLATTGIEVDESHRAPADFGSLVVDPGLCFLSPKQISVMIDCLRAQAHSSPLLKAESFVKCANECASSNGFPNCWANPAYLKTIAMHLDPLRTGQISWRRFIHGLLSGLLPRLPTVEELLSIRIPVTPQGLINSRRFTVPPLEVMAPQRVTTNEFLYLPWWFDTLMPPERARGIKELYALTFAEDDGRIPLLPVLLQLCESLSHHQEESLPPFPFAILKAAILACQPFEPDQDIQKALQKFEITIGSNPHKISFIHLQGILAQATHLHTMEKAASWLEAQGFSKDHDLPIPDILTTPNWSGPAAPFQICDVYAIINKELSQDNNQPK